MTILLGTKEHLHELASNVPLANDLAIGRCPGGLTLPKHRQLTLVPTLSLSNEKKTHQFFNIESWSPRMSRNPSICQPGSISPPPTSSPSQMTLRCGMKLHRHAHEHGVVEVETARTAARQRDRTKSRVTKAYMLQESVYRPCIVAGFGVSGGEGRRRAAKGGKVCAQLMVGIFSHDNSFTMEIKQATGRRNLHKKLRYR